MSTSLPTGKAYSRLDDFPLDNSSVFDTLTEAEEYAANSPIAYHTQIIGVREKNMTYMITETGTLKPMISSGEGSATVEEEITLVGTSLGALPDGGTIPQDISLTDLIKLLAIKRIAANYLAPTLSLSGSGTKNVEAGQSVSTTLTPTFVQNDGGVVTQYKIQKNGTDIHTDTVVDAHSPAATIIGDENWTFRASATYADGLIKNDNLGTPSPDGAISSGSVSSGNVVFSGKRYTFYDADIETSAATTSGQVRAMAGKVLGQAAGATFTMNCPAGTTRFSIFIPAALTGVASIKYVEQGNAEYLDLFEESSVQVEGHGGYATAPYLGYTYLPAVPTGAPMTFHVTLES